MRIHGGVRGIRTLLTGSVAGLLCFGGLALWIPARGSAAVDCSQGRTVLECSEKVALYNDLVGWSDGGFLDLDLFATPRQQHLHNPALAQFWRYESATALARSAFEFVAINQGFDQDFEQTVKAAKFPAPKLGPSGVVNRQMARALRALLRAEQQEVVNLVAMDQALDRATAALVYGSRADWVAWQEYSAAGFARRAAAAIRREIPDQRRVTAAFVHAHLLFGVGSADQRAEQRRVRAHGFPAPVSRIMSMLGMTSDLISGTKANYLQAKLGPVTYSNARYLSSSTVIRNERRCANALLHFAGRIPAVPLPS